MNEIENQATGEIEHLNGNSILYVETYNNNPPPAAARSGLAAKAISYQLEKRTSNYE
jgi:hypothetical protein